MTRSEQDRARCDAAGIPYPSEPRPESAAFYQVLTDAKNMHDRKQKDYGSDTDPFANVRSAEDWGLPGSMGACIRIADKVARLKAFYRKGELANESVEDAFMDLLVYAGIGLVLLRQEQDSARSTGEPTRNVLDRAEVKPPVTYYRSVAGPCIDRHCIHCGQLKSVHGPESNIDPSGHKCPERTA